MVAIATNQLQHIPWSYISWIPWIPSPLNLYVHLNVYVYIYMYMWIFLYVDLHMYILYIYMYIFISTFFSICIYIYIYLDHMHQIAGPDPSLKTQCVKQKLKNAIGTTQKQNQYMPRICNYWGMDHGMDHGVWIACGPGVWIGTLHFELQPYISIYIHIPRKWDDVCKIRPQIIPNCDYNNL